MYLKAFFESSQPAHDCLVCSVLPIQQKGNVGPAKVKKGLSTGEAEESYFLRKIIALVVGSPRSLYGRFLRHSVTVA